MRTLARYFIARSYIYEDGDPVPFFDVTQMLRDGVYRSCLGYFGDAKLENGWHSLWGFETRRKAKRFKGEGDLLLTMKELNPLMGEGRFTRRAHYLTDDDPPEQVQ